MCLPQNPLLRHVPRQPTPLQRHVPPAEPATATCARPAGSFSATCAPGESATATCDPSADPAPATCTPAGPATATCDPSADPASATCAPRRTPYCDMCPPSRILFSDMCPRRIGYCDMYPASRSRLSDMCLPQDRLLRHVTRRPIPPQRHVPPAGPATATCDCRRRSWSLGLETPTFAHRVGPGDVTVPAGRTRYRTQFRPAGPDIAPSSRRPDPGLPPAPRQPQPAYVFPLRTRSRSQPKKCPVFKSHWSAPLGVDNLRPRF